MRRKVQFYAKEDLASGFNFEHAVQLLDAGITPADANDNIEVYNINRYFDEGMRLNTWSDDDFNAYQEKAKKLKKEVFIFFDNLNDDNFVKIFKSIEYYLTDAFWDIFNYKRCYEKISKENFGIAANHNTTNLEKILKYKKIVLHYDNTIRENLLDYVHSANIILEYHNTMNSKNIFLPKSMTNDDKEKIICKYIESNYVHPSTLDLIIQIQPSRDFSIHPMIKLKAKKKCQEIEKLVLQNGATLNFELTILFQKQYMYAICKNSGAKTELFYSKDWIEKNTDYPTLLNNFIYVFEFVNIQCIFNGMSCNHEMGTFERLLAPSDEKYYPTSASFNLKFRIMLLQMIGYSDVLHQNNISLSSVIEWFFCEYLKDEFKIENFNIHMPSQDSSYLEKCTFLVTVIDSILKQYELYIEYGYIDHEILTMQSNSKKIYEIKTLIENKYVFGAGDNYAKATHLLFSDQSSLVYTSQNNGLYKNFFDLIKYSCPLLSDFDIQQKKSLTWLVSNKFLLTNTFEEIKFSDYGAIIILKHLFELGSIKSIFYYKKYENSIQRLYNEGYIDYYSRLFTTEETRYLNFILNKADFRNGHDLRNKYAHGIQQAIKNDDEHIQNYNILLHIIILLAIKINDDLCTHSNVKDA